MFSEKERKVFSYHDGIGEKWADPLRVRRILLRETGGCLDDCWEKAAAVGRALINKEPPTAEMLACEETLMNAGRRAFGLIPLDPLTGEGATDADVWACLRAWSTWVKKHAAGGESGPTSSAPSGSSPGPGSPTAGSAPST